MPRTKIYVCNHFFAGVSCLTCLRGVLSCCKRKLSLAHHSNGVGRGGGQAVFNQLPCSPVKVQLKSGVPLKSGQNLVSIRSDKSKSLEIMHIQSYKAYTDNAGLIRPTPFAFDPICPALISSRTLVEVLGLHECTKIMRLSAIAFAMFVYPYSSVSDSQQWGPVPIPLHVGAPGNGVSVLFGEM